MSTTFQAQGLHMRAVLNETLPYNVFMVITLKDNLTDKFDLMLIYFV